MVPRAEAKMSAQVKKGIAASPRGSTAPKAACASAANGHGSSQWKTREL
jgi:hypothetical protein